MDGGDAGFWKLAYKKACRLDIRDVVPARAKEVFMVLVLINSFTHTRG